MKRVFFPAMLLAGISVQAAPSVAEEWMSYHADGVNVVFYLDVGSVEISGNKRTVLAKAEFTTPKTSAQGPIKRVVERLEVNCLDRLQRRISEVAYDEAGTALYQLEEATGNSRIQPETVSERRLVAACGLKPRK